jgi:hypothetical protein
MVKYYEFTGKNSKILITIKRTVPILAANCRLNTSTTDLFIHVHYKVVHMYLKVSYFLVLCDDCITNPHPNGSDIKFVF